MNFKNLFKPEVIAHAHCDLPCGVYDPAQAKIEALSIKATMEKYAASSDIKEERSELVKHHLWVLWTDYFKPNHFEAYPQLHVLFNEATKLAGAGGTKGSNDVVVAEKLITKIDEIAEIFWATKK
jgi:nickel superoxide dismutase